MGHRPVRQLEQGRPCFTQEQVPKRLQRQHPISIKVTCACNAPHFAEVFRCCVHHTCFAQFWMLLRDPSQLPQSKVKALQTARHGVILALPLIARESSRSRKRGSSCAATRYRETSPQKPTSSVRPKQPKSERLVERGTWLPRGGV